MKPVSLCLVEMGKKGLELVRAYPEILPQEEVNNIVLKSMPLGANDGDFATNTTGTSVISSYVFSLPGEERTNIASLIAVFSSMNYQPQVIKKVFSFTVTELRKNNAIDKQVITDLLPKLYDGLVKGELRIKISSVVTLDLAITSELADEKKDPFDAFGEDVWK